MAHILRKLAAENIICDKLIYLVYRICTLFYSALFLIFRIFPIKENKIVCCDLKGKYYGDNPKYISDEIIRQDLDYELVWLLKDKTGIDLPKQIKRAPYNPFSLAYHLSTAKIWIDCHTKIMGTLKRRGQIYIQTWHGSYGLKKIAYDIKNHSCLLDIKPFDYNAKIEDLMVSNSRVTTKIYRSAFRYNGKVLECGSPRNDIFFEDSSVYIDKVDKYFNICGKKILLYAPTFRADYNTDCMHMDFEKILEAFEKRFGGEWVALIRMHPHNIKDAERFINYSDKIINATDYDVMQELLAASDILITDYSSCMFDFVTRGKPCFLYATDIERYNNDRGMYYDIMTLPFPVARDNDEMIKNIYDFNETIYANKLNELFEQVGLCDKGTASKKVVEYIKSVI